MAIVKFSLSIITSAVKELNSPIKRHRLADGFFLNQLYTVYKKFT